MMPDRHRNVPSEGGVNDRRPHPRHRPGEAQFPDLRDIARGSGSIQPDRFAGQARDASPRTGAMRRLFTVSVVGPVAAGTIMAFAPDLRTFASGRNFVASLSLVPRQRSTGGETRRGSVSKVGQTDTRKLLIVGAMCRIRWIVCKGVLPNNWLGHALCRKQRMVAAVTLANKMAGMIWAIMTRKENYRMA